MRGLDRRSSQLRHSLKLKPKLFNSMKGERGKEAAEEKFDEV